MRVQIPSVRGGGSGSGGAAERATFRGGGPAAGTPTPPPTESGLSLAEVRAAIAACPPNGTVLLPAGSAAWNDTLVITTPLTLRGAGRDLTHITCNQTQNLIDITIPAGAVSRICHLDFIEAAPGHTGNGVYLIATWGQGQIRVDHNRFTVTTDLSPQVRSFVTNDGITGCFDNNTCAGGGGLQAAVVTGHPTWKGVGDYGDNSWATPTNWGSGEFMFYEDNVFSMDPVHGSNMFAHDSHRGARLVFRFNRLVNANVPMHGTEAGGRGRGTRAAEIYENIADHGAIGSAVFSNLRSGSALMWNNQIGAGYTAVLRADNDRSMQSFGTWLACDGAFPFDVNDGVIYASGTCTAGTSVTSGNAILVDSTKDWTAFPDFAAGGYSVHNLTTLNGYPNNPGTGDLEGSYVLSQGTPTVHTLTLKESLTSGNHPVFLVGDQYQVLRCTIAMDCCGRGPGDLLRDNPPVLNTTGVPGWPHQGAEPLYAWGNTIPGMTDTAANTISTIGMPHIKLGRDYFNNTEKVYTPYVRKHPLRTAGPTWTPGDE